MSRHLQLEKQKGLATVLKEQKGSDPVSFQQQADWDVITGLLPNKSRGVARVDDRRVINGIFYVLRTGSPWRDLPERYGPYTTIYNRYNRWAKAGVWLEIFETLAAQSPQSMQMIDSSIVRAHQHAAGGKKGARITPLAVLVED